MRVFLNHARQTLFMAMVEKPDEIIEAQKKKIGQDYKEFVWLLDKQIVGFEKSIKYSEKNIKDLRQAAKYYIKDADYRKDVLERLKMLESRKNYGSYLLSDLKFQKNKIHEVYENAEDRIPDSPKKAAMIEGYVKDKAGEYVMKFSEYAHKLNEVIGEIGSGMEKISESIKSRVNQKEGGQSHAGNAVVAAMTAVFGGSVLYALSSVRPENITGAFAAGASSPIMAVTIVAAVILVLFFLTQHKIHERPKTEYD